MEQTLVLNASYEPLRIVNWQRAMVLVCQKKAEVVDVHDRIAHAVTFSFKLPSIVRLLHYVKTRLKREHVPFTRANIYRRDDFSCGYCGETFPTEDLTFDHVVPAVQGGKKSWDNIMTACLPCNRKKGGRTPAEAGMTLKKLPVRPAPSPIFRVTIGLRKTPERWRDYLYWNVELES